jgi:gas vesicle protein
MKNEHWMLLAGLLIGLAVGQAVGVALRPQSGRYSYEVRQAYFLKVDTATGRMWTLSTGAAGWKELE